MIGRGVGVFQASGFRGSRSRTDAESAAPETAPLAPQALETGDFGIVEPIL